MGGIIPSNLFLDNIEMNVCTSKTYVAEPSFCVSSRALVGPLLAEYVLDAVNFSSLTLYFCPDTTFARQ